MQPFIKYFILSFVLIFSNNKVQSSTYYVSAEVYTECNQRDGSRENPWCTIQDAADLVSKGDTVIVMPGNYGRTNIGISGLSTGMIVFKGEFPPKINYTSQGNAVLNNPENMAVTQGFDIDGDYIRIENFEITDIGSDNKGGIYLSGNQDIEIVNNYIHNLECDNGDWGIIRGSGTNITFSNNVGWRVEGIALFLSGENWLVENNNISHGSDLRWSDGNIVAGDCDVMRFFGRDHIIRGNNFHDYIKAESEGDPHMDCFQTYSVNGEIAQYILIENNICSNIGSQMFMAQDADDENNVHHITFRNNIFNKVGNIAINAHSVDYFTFVNNVVAEAGYDGIRLRDECNNSVVMNNIFYNNWTNESDERGQSLTEEASKVGSVWDYNMHYPDFTYPAKQPEFDINGMFGIDPMFVDPVSGNFNLMEESEAIDKGFSLPDFSYDIDNTIRPIGEGWDIGAYEYKSPTTINEYDKNLPQDIKLYQNYPNPFNLTTYIEFKLANEENVILDICNTSGQRLETLINKRMSAGLHNIKFDAENLPSGLYYYRIITGEFHQVNKMVLLK